MPRLCATALHLNVVVFIRSQAHVYELRDKEGRLAPIVLKASRQAALISDNKREWATGQRLGALGPGERIVKGRIVKLPQ